MKTFKDQYFLEAKGSGSDKSIAKSIVKSIPELKALQSVESKRVIKFKFKAGLDENDFDNFNKIDSILDFLKKKYPGSIVEHDFDTFTVKEL